MYHFLRISTKPELSDTLQTLHTATVEHWQHSVLVSIQAVQIASYTIGLAALAFAAVGILVTGASIYFLYFFHWR
ncbi:hypothetical protein DJ69_03805 [Halorubrum persicum]|uniref:Uncharacterized protein n=1 Tax=Halorubrum persicum TaxID=1383844 RepID=A0A2G1WLK7_9EURY|nr:hypothetical protein DJ69_03805 [Halorubrum persicum]